MIPTARFALASIGAAAGLALALPAAAQPDKGPGCFLTRDIRNHTVADDKTMYIDVGGRAVYRVTMSSNCLAGSTSSDAYVLKDTTGSGRICNKLDFDISVRGNRCIVDSITKLTPQEAAALPKRVRP